MVSMRYLSFMGTASVFGPDIVPFIDSFALFVFDSVDRHGEWLS